MNPTKVTQSQELAEFCGLFGNSRRIQIVWVLGDQELTVGEIAHEIDASMQNTSQHLRLMKIKGVLESRRDGREIYYRIADTKLINSCPVINHKKMVLFTE
jgi:ArsR family transcriptional regulator